MDWNERIQVNFAVSDANRADEHKGIRLPQNLDHYLDLYCAGTGQASFSMELQPEKVFVTHIGDNRFIRKESNPWWKTTLCGSDGGEPYSTIAKRLQEPGNVIYLHQPCQSMDWIAPNPFKSRQSIETAKQAMSLAAALNAEVFTFHILQQDRWELDRSSQIEAGYTAFNECVRFYNEQDFSFTPAIENLEFPKFPSTAGEILSVLERYEHASPKIKIVLDIAHLWRSRAIILENGDTFKTRLSDFEQLRMPFDQYLEYTLQQLPQEMIAYYHIAGAYGIVTHGIPGIHDSENPFTYWIQLDGSDEYYDQHNEMNIRRVIDLLIHYVLDAGFPLKIILEIHNRTDTETLRGLQVFRSRLLAKAMAYSRR